MVYYPPIRTYGKYKDMDLYTLKQLQNMFMLPKKNAKVYTLWTNGYKEYKADYYELKQCRAMTHEEQLSYKDSQIQYWKNKFLKIANIVLSEDKSKLNDWKINHQYLKESIENKE